MNLKFTHIRLLVTNIAACFRFYRDVMGFTPTWGSKKDVYADFKTGATDLALFDRGLMAAEVGTSQKPFEMDAQDTFCLIFEVENVDTAYQELVQRGAQTVVGPTDHPGWGVRTAHFRDPDGNLIEINHPIPMEGDN